MHTKPESRLRRWVTKNRVGGSADGAPTESSEVNLPDVGGLPGGDLPGLPKMPKGAKRSSWKDGTKVITVVFLDGKVVEKTISGL